MKIKYLILVLLLAPFYLGAQEALIDLHGNPEISRFLQTHTPKMKTKTAVEDTDTIRIGMQLPFFDDFTYPGPYPDTTLWEDNDAFINTSFQLQPTNRGVATLDALDGNGQIHRGAGPFSFIADHLTSRMIRTDSLINETEQRPLTLLDSLFISFFYQPQGRGNAPDKNDSLVLEFFVEYADSSFYIDSMLIAADTIWINPNDTSQGWSHIEPEYWDYDTIYIVYPEQWKTVWSTAGMDYETFYALHNKPMMQVMIPITDTTFLRPDFRFRFKNYASLASNILPSWQSNMDQWNIDYVYFNYGRSALETAYQDISFVEPGRSLLNGYHSIPYKQFLKDGFSLMVSEFPRSYTNLDKVDQNATYKYRVYNEDGVQIGSDGDYYGIEWTQPLRPGIVEDNVPVVVMYPSYPGKKSTFFTVEQTLVGDLLSSDRLCDTIRFVQEFSDYIAYDDGTPEAGYGLSDTDCFMATLFTLSVADTLKAIDIYFNDTPKRQDSSYSEYFDLYIWRENHGEPGNEPEDLYYMGEMMLQGAEAGKFVRFELDELIIVNGGFFVGIMQYESDNINIGFDYSNNTQSKNLYKLYNGPWKTTQYEGSMMIRPVFGTPELGQAGKPKKSQEIVVSPNPAYSGQEIVIETPASFEQNHRITIDIFDGAGKKQLDSAPLTTEKINLRHLAPGFYIIRLMNHSTGESATTKLIITQ